MLVRGPAEPVPDSPQEDPELLEKISKLSLEPQKSPVLVPFTPSDVEVWKDYREYRKNRRSWDAWREEEWKSHDPHIHAIFNNWPILETPRLQLRLLRESDAVDAHRVLSDEKAMRYYGTAAHKDLEYTQSNFITTFISRFKLHDGVSFVITLKKEDGTVNDDYIGHVNARYIGHINVMHFDRSFHFAEIAYIVNPDYWGRGIATEAVSRVVKFLLEDMKVHKVRASCFADNVASRKVLDKVGFKQEGYLRDNSVIDGKFVDEYLMAIIASDVKTDTKP